MEREFEIFQSGTLPRQPMVLAWHWECGFCGWKGLNLGSEDAATHEATRHVSTHHGGRVRVEEP